MLIADLRQTLRMLVKRPAFAIIMIVTIALGVGVNTAIFSVMNFFLLRPLPVPNPDRLVVMAEQTKGTSEFISVSYPDLLDFQKDSAGVELAAYQTSQVGLSSEGKSERAVVNYVTGNYFPVLGVRPEVGRLISPDEGQHLGADPVLVLGNSYWRRRFSSDRGMIGKTVVANGHAFTVIGVAQESFHGVYAFVDPDVYIPLSMATVRTVVGADSSEFWTKRDTRNLRIIGRLRSGVTLEAAQTSLNVVAQRLAGEYPNTNKDLAARLFPERLARPEPTDSNLLPIVSGFFLLLAGTVMLVACVNVANVLLVRSIGRRRETAIRTALGARRGQIIRQILMESIMIALAGAAGGIVLGSLACDLLERISRNIDLPLFLDLGMDWRVFAYSMALALLTGVLVGVMPAMRASRSNVAEVLHEGGRGVGSGVLHQRLRNILVVCQIAVSLVLLIIAGLFLRSLDKAQNLDLGFNPDKLLNVSMDTQLIGYDEPRGKAFYKELESRIRALPGVESASLSFSVAFGVLHSTAKVFKEGTPVQAAEATPEITYNTVDPAYFQNLRIPLVTGRFFTDADNASVPRVAVINEAMAQQFWPNEDAVGKRFAMENAAVPLIQVIGVAKNGKYLEPSEEVAAYFFLPVEQHYVSFRTLQVRTSVPPETMIPEVEKVVRSLAPDMPMFDVRTMRSALNGINGFFLFRIGAGLTATLGLLALALATVGVYGVVSYSVSQRTHEIGIRSALGAQRGDILKMILKQGVAAILSGIALGLVLAVGAGGILKSMLVGVGPYDPLTFIAISGLLAGIATIASLIPALRALRIDPSRTLRND
jgi:putative ABC transport system permease protein